jgi:outer membrane protein OmpA-like peptidoglycan-associated protein
VVEYLISQGVPRSEFVSVTGAGESQPVADNKTADGRALNRRTEIKINR